MSKTTFLILILAVTGWAIWESRYQTGERLLKEGKAEGAVSELKQALAEAGETGRGVVLDALGRAESRLGHFRDAKRHIEASLPLWPLGSRERAVILHNLGQVHLRLQEDARAEQLFSQATETLPGEASVWHSLGQAQFRRKRRELAEASLRKALSLADSAMKPNIASDLATILEANHQYAKAAEIWREAISQAKPGQGRARMLANLAALQWKWNAKEEAANQFRAALAEMENAVGPRHPDLALILENYQAVLLKTGKKAEALAAGERAVAIRSSFASNTNDQQASVDWRDLRR